MKTKLPQRNDDLPSLVTKFSIGPISRLPPELLNLIFSFSLLMVDPMHKQWQYRDCWRYMVGLYNLRRVSTLWRDVIDTTPSFWTHISLSWPQEVVKAALFRSATYPIIIHHYPVGLRTSVDPVELSRRFLHLVRPHRSRWVAGVVTIPVQRLSEFFDAPIPQFHTLRLSLTGGSPSQVNSQMLSLTPTFTEILKSLERVHLTTCAFQYDQVLDTFTRLKSLVLTNPGPQCITIDQIIRTIRNNPSLEILLLIGLDATADSTMPENTTPTALPRLRTFRVESSVAYLYDLLTRVELPITIKGVVLIALATGSSWQLRTGNIPLGIDAMSPLSPIMQKLHAEKDGSTIFLEDGGRCKWATNGDAEGFKFRIGGLNHPLALGGIASLTRGLDWASGLPDLSFASDSAFIAEASTLVALSRIEALASIEISIGRTNTHIDQFLEFLSGTIEVTEDNSIAFPSLRTLKIRGWESGMGEIIDAVKRRYSNQVQRPRHQLVLDFTTSEVTWFEDPECPKPMFSMGEVAELRGLDGVKSVRLGCSGEERGMVAVVWSEEKSQPVWAIN